MRKWRLGYGGVGPSIDPERSVDSVDGSSKGSIYSLSSIKVRSSHEPCVTVGQVGGRFFFGEPIKVFKDCQRL